MFGCLVCECVCSEASQYYSVVHSKRCMRQTSEQSLHSVRFSYIFGFLNFSLLFSLFFSRRHKRKHDIAINLPWSMNTSGAQQILRPSLEIERWKVCTVISYSYSFYLFRYFSRSRKCLYTNSAKRCRTPKKINDQINIKWRTKKFFNAALKVAVSNRRVHLDATSPRFQSEIHWNTWNNSTEIILLFLTIFHA